MSELLLSDFIDPMAFFQGVHDAPALQLEANHNSARVKVRASGIGSCARGQAYMLAGTPKSNAQRDNPDRVDQQYANEQGRQAEEISFHAIENQPGRTVRLVVVGRQAEVPARFPFTGHPDGQLAWLLAGEEWAELSEAEQARRLYFTPAMFGREGDEKFTVGVEHKNPGAVSYKTVLRQGVASAKTGWLYQGALYAEAFAWDYLLVVTVALDASATRTPQLGLLKYVEERHEVKAHFDLFDMRELRAAWYKKLARRAQVLNTNHAEGGEPGAILREFKGSDRFPCGYCEWQDRCNIDGDGIVAVPKLPAQKENR